MSTSPNAYAKRKSGKQKETLTSRAYKTATLSPLTRLRDRLLYLDIYRCAFAPSLTPDQRQGDP